MTIVVEKSGIMATVQDAGRFGYRRFGVNPGGPMDRTATRLLNILLGSDESAAVVEMHFPAPQFRFEDDAVIAIGGADFAAEIDGRDVQTWAMTNVAAGSTLRFTERRSGARVYLAIRGGFDGEKWLGSRSTNLAAGLGGIGGRFLAAGDRLLAAENSSGELPATSHVRISPSLVPRYSAFPTVRMIAGAEFDKLDAGGRETLLTHPFVVTRGSDRMGFRLAGDDIHTSRRLELLSSAVDIGTIQLLPDGQLVVLMADHQTTGGYPRVGHIISIDIPLVGQLSPGDKVGFHLIDILEAERLNAAFECELSFLRVGCRFLTNRCGST